MNGLSKRKSHRLLSQCHGLELAQTFPVIDASQGEEMAQRIQKKQGAISKAHPCLGKFIAYKRCIAQFSNSYLSKCQVTASRYQECLSTNGEGWEPPVSASFTRMLHSLNVFTKKRQISNISNLGAGSVLRLKPDS